MRKDGRISDLYGDAIEAFKQADDKLEYHLKTCGECEEHGSCPLLRYLTERYNFWVLWIRNYEQETGREETALPQIK